MDGFIFWCPAFPTEKPFTLSFETKRRCVCVCVLRNKKFPKCNF